MQARPTSLAWPTFSDEQPSAADQAAYVVFDTPSNLLEDPTFDTADDDDPWTTPADWAIATGKATHTPGFAGSVTQTGVLTVGDYFFTLIQVVDYVANSVKLVLGTSQGTARSTDGIFVEIDQCTVHTVFAIKPTGTAFDGAVTEVGVYNLNTETNAGNLTVIDSIDYSYDATPTGGGLQIADVNGVLYDVDIPNAGPGHIPFPHGFNGTRGKPLVVLLKSGGATVTGKLAVKTR